ncbi:MAG: SAM-dependent DNA methyltransferase, partial [Thermoprotei archaeon]
PNQKLIAFHSDIPLILSDLFHVISESDSDYGKAVTVLLNSIFALAYLFYMKEETTGRYTELRQHDLYKMRLYPTREQAKRLASIYEKYKDKRFPSLREQLDVYFDERYQSFWVQERKSQKILQPPPPLKPHDLRLKFDMDVIKAVGANLSEEELLNAYKAIVWDMIVTRGLRRD